MEPVCVCWGRGEGHLNIRKKGSAQQAHGNCPYVQDGKDGAKEGHHGLRAEDPERAQAQGNAATSEGKGVRARGHPPYGLRYYSIAASRSGAPPATTYRTQQARETRICIIIRRGSRRM